MRSSAPSNATAAVSGFNCADDGRVFAEAVGLRYDMTQGPDTLLPPVMDADGLTLSSIFALTPIGKPGEECAVSPQQTFVALQAGDLSPRVKILETKLNSLGHFLEFPNMVFDETTTKAVESFQTQYNIPVNGVVDRRTAETIESAALISAGGC